MGAFYKFIRVIIHFVLSIFISDWRVNGSQNIPQTAPAIIAGNHPNGLVDPAVVVGSCNRTVHFMAKATLFKNCVAGALFRGLGAIPVHRRQDEKASPQTKEQDDPATPSLRQQSNDDAFAAVHEVLRSNKCFAIFPEGVSHSDAQMHELKHGVSKIALSFLEEERKRRQGTSKPLGEEERDRTLLQIVPVGLNYVQGHRFRGKVWVKFGSAIVFTLGDVLPDESQPEQRSEEEGVKSSTDKGATKRALLRDYFSGTANERKEAVATLTAMIASCIRYSTVQARTWDDLSLIMLAARCYRPSAIDIASSSPVYSPASSSPPSSHHRHRYKMKMDNLIQIAVYFSIVYNNNANTSDDTSQAEGEEERAKRAQQRKVLSYLRVLLDEYSSLLSSLRLSDDDVRYGVHKPVSNVRLIVLTATYALCGIVCAVVAVPGVIINAPIALTVRRFGAKLAAKGGRDVLATFKIIIAFVMVPFVYGVYIGVFAWLFGQHCTTHSPRITSGAWVGILLVGLPLLGLVSLWFWERTAGLSYYTYTLWILWTFRDTHMLDVLTQKRSKIHGVIRALVAAQPKPSDFEHQQLLEDLSPEILLYGKLLSREEAQEYLQGFAQEAEQSLSADLGLECFQRHGRQPQAENNNAEERLAKQSTVSQIAAEVEPKVDQEEGQNNKMLAHGGKTEKSPLLT